MGIRMKGKSPYFWIPTLYFAEGAPASIIGDVSLIIFKNLGMTDAQNTFWKNFVGLVPILLVKLLGGPLVDSTGSKRMWIIMTQFAMSLLFAAAAGACAFSPKMVFLIGVFMMTGFVSAMHDIAADGFYILALSEHDQALFSGLRSVFFRVALLAANGGLVMLAGLIMEKPELTASWGILLVIPGAAMVLFSPRHAAGGGLMFLTGLMITPGKPGLSPGVTWGILLLIPALFMALFATYHTYALPRRENDTPARESMKEFFRTFGSTFTTFFAKRHIGAALAFILLYRLGEAQLGDVSRLFLINSDSVGMSTLTFGFLTGTIGVITLLAGGVTAGFLVAKFGMGKLLWPMVLAINVPDFLYVILSFSGIHATNGIMQSADVTVIGSAIALEQFGYGFGFTGFMLFMVWFASTSTKSQTSHFALLTFFMIAGLRLPAMGSGAILQNITEWAGMFVQTDMTRYQLFFIWVIICTIPGYFVTWNISKIIEPEYGLKR